MNRKIVFLLAPCLLALAAAWTHFSSAGYAAPAEEAASDSAGPQEIDASQFPNLQAAIDAVPAVGGIVRIPPGKYPLQQPLVVSGEDIRIQGSGTATHLINENTNGQPAIHLSAGKKNNGKFKRLWRVQLADLRISGSKQSGDGVLAEGINEIYLHNLAIDHNGRHGIYLVDCYEDPRISDCIITYNAQTGIEIQGGHDIVVSANQLEENHHAVVCQDSFNLCMNGNNLDDHLGSGVVIHNTYGSVVSGNMIEECQGVGIRLDKDCYGITLSANVIAHNMSGGIALQDAWGCAVSANTFVLNHRQALVIAKSAGRMTVTGNSFCNSHAGGKTIRQGPKQDAANGVLLQSTADIVLTGNNFTGLSSAAIRTEGTCQRIVVVGNNAIDLHRGSEGQGEAFELGELKDSTVENNLVP